MANIPIPSMLNWSRSFLERHILFLNVTQKKWMAPCSSTAWCYKTLHL